MNTPTKKHRKRSFSVLFSFIFTGIAYFFAKLAIFQNRTTTFLTTATLTFDHYCPKVASKNTIFGCEETNLKFTGMRSNFATSAALFLCFRHSNFSKFKCSKKIFNVSNRFSLPSRTPLTFTLKTSQTARLELEASNATRGQKTSLHHEICPKVQYQKAVLGINQVPPFFVLGVVIFHISGSYPKQYASKR